MQRQGSVTHWIHELKAGDQSVAQQELWNRYFRRLVALARARLRETQRRVEDEEDAVLSALNSFFRGVQRGRYPDLHDRTQLWPLLVRITASKLLNQVKRQGAQKRGGGRLHSESALTQLAANQNVTDLEQIIGTEPTPELAAQVAEQCQQLLDTLDNDSLRTVASLKLEGYTNREISQKLDVAERTIERKLRQIRGRWSESLEQ